MNKRLDYLDMAKGIGILLVLIGHLQGESIFQFSPYIQPLCIYIFSFHMPLFFIITGILIAVKHTDERDFIDVAKGRFKAIMVPYYWFSLFYISIVVVALIKGEIVFQNLLLNVWYIISGYGMNVLWFLPALYLGELLFLWLKKKLPSIKSFLAVIVVSCAVVCVIAYLLTLPDQSVIVYKRFREVVTVIIRPVLIAGFITIGYYTHVLCEKDNKIATLISRPELTEDGKITLKYRLMYIFSGVILMGICLLFMKVNNGIDVRSMALRNIFFFLLCALSGSYGLILICKGLPRMRLVCFWGTGSLIFMATHNSSQALHYAMLTAMYVNQYLTRARGYICYAIVIAVITLYSTFMIFIIQRFFPFIIGKSKKKARD